MAQTPLTIDEVSWHTRTVGNPESREHILQRFYAIAKFLQENGLTTRTLVTVKDEIRDDFAISTSDLTAEGFALIKSGYDKWLKKIDQGADAEDVRCL